MSQIFYELTARKYPDRTALIAPTGRGQWKKLSYGDLNAQADAYAHGFQSQGIERGDRVLFLVNPGFDFYTTLFGLFRLGAIPVLLDPGMGLKNVLKCIEQIQPKAMLAIPTVHIIRLLKRRAFRSVKILITAGSRWFWGGVTLKNCKTLYKGCFHTQGALHWRRGRIHRVYLWFHRGTQRRILFTLHVCSPSHSIG